MRDFELKCDAVYRERLERAAADFGCRLQAYEAELSRVSTQCVNLSFSAELKSRDTEFADQGWKTAIEANLKQQYEAALAKVRVEHRR